MSNSQREKLVYAILDNKSNTTFVTEAVCEALHPEFEPVKLKLTTITEKESNITCQRISSLRARGYTSNTVIDISSAYTRETIPADSIQPPPPSNETAKNWSHLRSIVNQIPPFTGLRRGAPDWLQLLTSLGASRGGHWTGWWTICSSHGLRLEHSWSRFTICKLSKHLRHLQPHFCKGIRPHNAK